MLTNLKPGGYILHARKGGYLGGDYGQYSPSDEYQVFDLRAGEKATNVTLQMWQQSVIAGSVRGYNGEPLVGTPVQAIRIVPVGDHVELQSGFFPTTTNDRGEYRLARLEPGRYFVCASVTHRTSVLRQGLALAPLGEPSDCDTFFPSAVGATDARVIAIDRSGDERSGVDITAQTPTDRRQTVDGRVEGLPNIVRGTRVTLVLMQGTADVPAGLEVAVTDLHQDGSFLFPSVAPGRYDVRGLAVPEASATSPSVVVKQTRLWISPMPDSRTTIAALPKERARWFHREIEVTDRPIRNLTITAQTGLTVNGRVILEAGSELSSLELTAIPVIVRAASDGWNLVGLQVGRVEADGTFATAALPPGTYQVTPAYGDWFVESATLNGRDVRNEGIEIENTDIHNLVVTLTRHRASVVGVVRDGSGSVRPEAVLYFFPADRRNWAFGDAQKFRPNRAGEYSVTLDAGDWVFAAAVGNPPNWWRDPAFLATLTGGGKKVSVAKGQRITVNLQVQTIR